MHVNVEKYLYIINIVRFVHVLANVVAILAEVHYKEYITKVDEIVHKCIVHIQLAQCTVMDYLKLGNSDFGTKLIYMHRFRFVCILCLFYILFDQNMWYVY